MAIYFSRAYCRYFYAYVALDYVICYFAGAPGEISGALRYLLIDFCTIFLSLYFKLNEIFATIASHIAGAA